MYYFRMTTNTQSILAWNILTECFWEFLSKWHCGNVINMPYWPTFYTQYQTQCLTLSTILIQSFFKHLAHFFIIKCCLKRTIPICFFTENIWRLICLIFYDYYVAELNKNNKPAATLGGAGSMPARSPSYYSSARTRSRGRNRSPYTPYSRSRSRGRSCD